MAEGSRVSGRDGDAPPPDDTGAGATAMRGDVGVLRTIPACIA
jgi:hypothetical protein